MDIASERAFLAEKMYNPYRNTVQMLLKRLGEGKFRYFNR